MMERLKEMIRDNQKLVMSVVLGVIALLTALFVVKPFGSGSSDSPVESAPMAVYLIEDESANSVLTEEMLGLKEYEPEEDEEVFESTSDLVGAELLEDLDEGSIILSEQVDVQDVELDDFSPSGISISGDVPEGLRAIMMPSGASEGMVSHLEEGDRIDLLVSHSEGDGLETITPFQNVELLKIESNSYTPPVTNNDESEDGEEEVDYVEQSAGSSLILAMTPEQAELLSNMKMSGVIQTADITVRGQEDEDTKNLKGFSNVEIEDWRDR